MVNHDVEAKYLKAHGVLKVVWLSRPVQMNHMRLCHTYCLQDYFIDLLFTFDGTFEAKIVNNKV